MIEGQLWGGFLVEVVHFREVLRAYFVERVLAADDYEYFLHSSLFLL